MVYNVYTVKDHKSWFSQIWNDINDETAKRGFSQMMSNPDNVMGFNPQDFDLFKIGTFDSETGQLDSIWPIEFVLSGRAAFDSTMVRDFVKPYVKKEVEGVVDIEK